MGESNERLRFFKEAASSYLRAIWFDFIVIKLIMSTAERKAVIKHADMNEEMQQDAIDCANVALEKFNIEKDIAAYIKKEFDKKYNPTWHCVVGRNFGSYVTHETKHFIYFYMGQVAVLLFKSGWKTWSQSPLTYPQSSLFKLLILIEETQ